MSSQRGPRPHKQRRPTNFGDTVSPKFVGTCARTGKRSYLDRADAKKAIRILGTGNSLSAYRCSGPGGCGHWHIGHHRNGASREFYRWAEAQRQDGT